MDKRVAKFPGLVIFDLDGTLVDSVPDISVALNAALIDFGHAGASLDQVRGWVGNGAYRLVERALDEAAEPGQVDRVHQRFLERYAERVCEHSEIYPGVEDCLGWLRSNECLMACVTNKPYALAKQLLETLSLDHWFFQLLGADSLPRKKPDPEPLLHVMASSGMRHEETLMVGDSHSDVAAARAANIAGVCVSYGYSQGLDVHALGADYVVDSLSELPGLFEKARRA